MSHDRSTRQPDCPIRALGERRVVSHEQQRRAGVAIELDEQVDDGTAVLGVEASGRLVGEQDLGPVGERARDRNALLFTARELRRIVVGAVAESNALEKLPPSVHLPIPPLKLHRDEHILERCERWQQLERLKDESHFFSPEAGARVFGERPEVLAVEAHDAFGGAVEPSEQTEQRGLARAGRSRDRDKLPRKDGEINISEYREWPAAAQIGLLEGFGDDHHGGKTTRAAPPMGRSRVQSGRTTEQRGARPGGVTVGLAPSRALLRYESHGGSGTRARGSLPGARSAKDRLRALVVPRGERGREWRNVGSGSAPYRLAPEPANRRVGARAWGERRVARPGSCRCAWQPSGDHRSDTRPVSQGADRRRGDAGAAEPGQPLHGRVSAALCRPGAPQ